MNRTGWLAVVIVGLLAGGLWVALRRTPSGPEQSSAQDCPPDQLRTFHREGYDYVACPQDGALDGGQGGGSPLNASAKWTVGLKVKLNAVSEQELTALPGVGPSLAKALVTARGERGGFKSWDEVDAVPGVGPVKLTMLQSVLEL